MKQKIVDEYVKIKKKAKEIENKIDELLIDDNPLEGIEYDITLIKVKKRSIDDFKLKSEHPEIYQECMIEKIYTRKKVTKK